MPPLRIDRGDFLLALQSSDLENYLDLTSGMVIPIFEDGFLDDFDDDLEDDFEAAGDRIDVAGQPERYRRIDTVPSYQGFRWMEDFAFSQEDDRLREELLLALDRKRPFRSFKDALLGHPEARERWFAFEEGRLLEVAREWLAGEGIEAELVDVIRSDPPPG